MSLGIVAYLVRTLCEAEVRDMKKGLRPWFYPEAILGMLSAVLFVVTLINRQWIELAFRVDPDQGSGTLEWLVVGGLLVVTLALISLAGYEWRRASLAAA
jgi:hypothetical protein